MSQEMEALRKLQQEAVRKKCTDKNNKLKENPAGLKEEISTVAMVMTQGILSNPILMQMLIGNAMGSKASGILKPHEVAMPTMADFQEACLTAVDMGYRLALQHNVQADDISIMNYNHCRFAVPPPSELQQPTN